MEHLPEKTLARCVARYRGNHKIQSFTCQDQFCACVCATTFRESLRDIEACLRSQTEKLLPHGYPRAGLAQYAGQRERDAGLADLCRLAQRLIGIARNLYINEPFGVDLANTAYALDSTTIDLSLSLFPWAPFRTTKAAVKMHTLLDLRGNIPKLYSYLRRQAARREHPRSVNSRSRCFLRHGSRYIDFQRLYRLHQAGSFFVTRAKRNMDAQRRYSHPRIDPLGDLRSDARVAGISVRQGLPGDVSRYPLQGSADQQALAVHSATTPRCRP